MKVILSRKGFDKSAGGSASPIYNNRLISIPIPRVESQVFYKDLQFDDKYSFLKVMKDLKIKQFSEAHLDPDLRNSIMEGRDLWKAAFGQDDTAQEVLRRAGVGKGDLFLFFGWFREVEELNGTFKYSTKAHNIHAIFGYLEIGQIIKLKTDPIPSWARNHPHVLMNEEYPKNNTLYVSTNNLSFSKGKPGAGYFYYDKRLVLSKEGQKNRSVWELPSFFEGKESCFKIGVNLNKLPNGNIKLETRGHGMQELFICEDKEVVSWAQKLVSECSIYQ